MHMVFDACLMPAAVQGLLTAFAEFSSSVLKHQPCSCSFVMWLQYVAGQAMHHIACCSVVQVCHDVMSLLFQAAAKADGQPGCTAVGRT
jgi:hypothetical protein